MINQDRLELLQEMINIGFGRSSAAIADLLNLFVSMNVPKIYDLTANGIRYYLIKQVGVSEKINLQKNRFERKKPPGLTGELSLSLLKFAE